MLQNKDIETLRMLFSSHNYVRYLDKENRWFYLISSSLYHRFI